MPVAGQIDMPAAWAEQGRNIEPASGQPRSRRKPRSIRNSTQKLALTVALYARESNDLAGTDLKIDSLQDGVGQIAHHHGRNGAVVHFTLLGKSAFNRAPDMRAESRARKCSPPRTSRETGRHEGSIIRSAIRRTSGSRCEM